MTVPITEAMQITVSSAMAKRIDDSSSTLRRQASSRRYRARTAWWFQTSEGNAQSERLGFMKGGTRLDGPAPGLTWSVRCLKSPAGKPGAADETNGLAQRRPAM